MDRWFLDANVLFSAAYRVQQRCNGLNGTAEIARKNSVWTHQQIALVHKQNGTIVVGNRLTLSGVALVSMMKSSNLLLQEMKMQWHRYQWRVPIPPEMFTSTMSRPATTGFLRWRPRRLPITSSRGAVEPWKSRGGKT